MTAREKMQKEIGKMETEVEKCYNLYNQNFKIGQPLQAQKWLARANAFRDCIAVLKECVRYVS